MATITASVRRAHRTHRRGHAEPGVRGTARAPWPVARRVGGLSCRRVSKYLERTTGFEPATLTLAR
jgi:hypothetical protein